MSQKKYASLQTLQTFLTNLKNTFADLSHKHTMSDITDYVVDTELSADSTNPVQNKVIDAEFEAVATAMNALDAAIDQNVGSISNLNTLVGDIKVSDQIEAAQIVHVGPDIPTDPNIKVWIKTDEDGGAGVIPVLPRVSTITLADSGWTGGASPYSQVVSINTVTADTKVELNPTVAQIVKLQNDDIALMAENDGGVVTIYSFGGKPSENMVMQVTLTEVSYV